MVVKKVKNNLTTLSIDKKDAEEFYKLRSLHNTKKMKTVDDKRYFKELNQIEFFHECILMIKKQMKLDS